MTSTTTRTPGPAPVPVFFVVSLNQSDTKSAGDKVDELLAQLEPVPALVGFQRSYGDEAQGILKDANSAVDAALIALRQGRWHVGIGVGSLHLPLPKLVTEAEGYAMIFSRRAVNRAQKQGSRVPLAVEGQLRDAATEAEAVLRLLGQLVRSRSTAEWAILDLLVPGVRGQQEYAASIRGVSKQAVSKAIQRSGWDEEWAARPAAARLLQQVQPE